MQALRRTNAALWYVFGVVAAISALIMLVPVVQRILQFEHLQASDLAVAAAVGGVLFLLLELLKPLAKRVILESAAASEPDLGQLAAASA